VASPADKSALSVLGDRRRKRLSIVRSDTGQGLQ
jgi:hypothetical protein